MSSTLYTCVSGCSLDDLRRGQEEDLCSIRSVSFDALTLVPRDLADSGGLDGMKVVRVRPQVGPFVFPVGLCCIPSRTKGGEQLRQLRYWNEPTAYKTDVYILLKLLDEKIAKLRLSVLCAVHTVIPITSDLAEMLPTCLPLRPFNWRGLLKEDLLANFVVATRTKPSVSSWRLGVSSRT